MSCHVREGTEPQNTKSHPETSSGSEPRRGLQRLAPAGSRASSAQIPRLTPWSLGRERERGASWFGWSVGRSVGWSVSWLVGWFGQSVVWLVGWLGGRVWFCLAWFVLWFVQSVSQSVGRSVSQSVRRPVGRSVGWLVASIKIEEKTTSGTALGAFCKDIILSGMPDILDPPEPCERSCPNLWNTASARDDLSSQLVDIPGHTQCPSSPTKQPKETKQRHFSGQSAFGSATHDLSRAKLCHQC